MIARTLFRAVVPNRGPRSIKQEARDLGRKNTYFGHECERNLLEIPQRKFLNKYLRFEMKIFFLCVFFNENSRKIPSI